MQKSTLWRKIKVEGVQARREMVRNRSLLPLDEFCLRLGVSATKLAVLEDAGGIFSIAVDGTQYFPSVLAEPTHNRKRLQEICCILYPAPAAARLDFLTSLRASLNERCPLQMLDEDDDFNNLRTAALAWAAEWSRTSVTIYEGKHEIEPKDAEPLYTATAEIDPRRPLWERASEALHEHGYEWPLGPYPDVRSFTLLVVRHTAGDSTSILEACVQIVVDNGNLQIRIKVAPGTTLQLEPVSAGKHKTFIDIAKRVIASLKTSPSMLGMFLRDDDSGLPESAAAPEDIVSTTEAAAILFVSRPHVVKLIDEGLLPLHHRVGKNRFVRIVDVLAYKERKQADAKAWLDSQTEDTDPSGL